MKQRRAFTNTAEIEAPALRERPGLRYEPEPNEGSEP